jgi:hypothetical protein
MELVRPQNFQLCAVGSDEMEEHGLAAWVLNLKEFLTKNLFKLINNEELRIQRLIKLSLGKFFSNNLHCLLLF